MSISFASAEEVMLCVGLYVCRPLGLGFVEVMQIQELEKCSSCVDSKAHFVRDH